MNGFKLDQGSKSRLLLVEGSADKHVVRNLLCRYQLDSNFAICPKGGFQPMRDSIRAEVKASGRRVLGIIADANKHPARRWQSITDPLRQSGFSPPDAPLSSGTILSGPRGLRAGIWLMPDNHRPGELEDFIAGMIPPHDPVWPHSKRYVKDIPEADRQFKSTKLTRAQVHAWLATREEPRQIGLAISAQDLLHTEKVASSFVDWLRRLFQFHPDL